MKRRRRTINERLKVRKRKKPSQQATTGPIHPVTVRTRKRRALAAAGVRCYLTPLPAPIVDQIIAGLEPGRLDRERPITPREWDRLFGLALGRIITEAVVAKRLLGPKQKSGNAFAPSRPKPAKV